MIFLLVTMTLLWSGNFIVGKIALREFDAFSLAWLRMILSSVMLWGAFAFAPPSGEFSRISEHWRALGIIGVFGIGVNQAFFIVGLKSTSAAHASVIGSLTPVAVLVLSRLAGHESLSARKAVGLTLAVGGVSVLANLRPASIGPGPSLFGDLCIVGSVLSFAVGAVVSRPISDRFGSIRINAVGYTVGAVLLTPVSILPSIGGHLATISTQAWVALAYMAIGSSVIAYVIFFWAVKRIGATRASIFTYLQPVLVTMMGMVFLSEHISVPEAACAGVILFGVFLAERA